MSGQNPFSLAEQWGVAREFTDNDGQKRYASRETCEAMLAAMGVDRASPRVVGEPSVRVLRQGQRWSGFGRAELRLEDGATLGVDDALPADLPLGYHDLSTHDGEVRLIVCPHHSYLPPELRVWGWSVQLYSARSRQSWGIGDFADLRRLARWSREIGAGVLLVNPLCAVTPTVPQQASPYFPSSRRFRNPLYLNVEELPAADQCGDDMNKLIAAGHALNSEPLIDRNRVFQLKVDALNAIWRGDFSHDEFDLYCERQGESLTGFAVFCALAELRKEGDYRNWPAEFQRPDSAAVSQFAQQHTARVRFHKWLQWLLDEQLRRASQELPLVHDLPIGFDPGGADAWMWQDLLARGATVGAPPDQFNSQGQDWALPPFAPHKLQAARYEPFIETLRASMRHAGGLRIDHVMGLFRLYWIPQGFSPSEGAYVRYPADDLLGIVALESHRAGAWVAGEDLGTVEPEVRRRLFDERILTYRVALFEKDHPTNYPEQALAALTTHDLPTTAGLWSGADVQARRERGLSDEEQGWETIRAHLAAMSQLARDSSDADAIRALYEMLGRAPSAILVAALADALAVRQRTNMPGTINEWPNWCDTLPIMLDNIDSAQLPRQIAAALSR